MSNGKTTCEILVRALLDAGTAVLKVMELAQDDGKLDINEAFDIGDIIMLCEIHKLDLLQFLSDDPAEAEEEIHLFRNEFKRRHFHEQEESR